MARGGFVVKKAEVLLEVKKTEEIVERLRKDALAQKDNIIRGSRGEVLRILDEAKKKAQSTYNVKIDAINKEIDLMKEKIIGEGNKRANDLKNKAQANLERAVEVLVTRFENEVGNA
jgi:V/A-type H+-transporting ATPase subunit G/H